MIDFINSVYKIYLINMHFREWIESKRKERFSIQKNGNDVKLDQIKVTF